MSDPRDDISTLNSLIATTLDSVEGYLGAAKECEDGPVTTLFVNRAEERRTIATRLQQEVANLGGDPEDEGTLLGGAHRMFLGLKASVTGHDLKAIVNEVETGEDHILTKFEDALDDMDLSPSVRTIVESCYVTVKAGHDEMRDLKHTLNT